MKERKLGIINKLKDKKDGFSLIEVMVTLGVLLIVSTGILGLFSQGLQTTGTSKHMTTAIYVAKSQLETIKSTDFENITLLFPENVPLAVEEPSLPDEATWVTTYPDGENANPLTVTITVSWPEESETKTIQLTTQVTDNANTE